MATIAKPLVGGDADLGGLRGEPELVQVEQRVAQRGRIELRGIRR